MPRALRRATSADVRESDLILQLCLQTKMALDTGQVSQEIAKAVLDIMTRTHTNLLIRSGVLDRKRQRRYNARHGGIFSKNPLDTIFAGITLLLVGAWILV